MIAVEIDNAAGVNPFPALWAAAVTAAGVEVVQYSPRTALRQRFDVFHVHWPESLFGRVGRSPRKLAKSIGHLLVLSQLRARGVRIVWTAHNIAPNSQRIDPLSELCLRAFRSLVDEVWTLSAAGSKSVRARLGLRASILEMKHPVYPVDTSLVRSVVARSGLVLSFGEVRPYRGFLELVEMFMNVADESLTLSIVGARRPDDYSEKLGQRVQGARGVDWDARRLSDEELQRSILRAEIVCLPYVEVTNSGAALLALSLERPVLVPDFPVFRELREEVGTAWVGLMSGNLEHDIRELRRAPRQDPPRLEARSWEAFGEVVRQACERVRSD